MIKMEKYDVVIRDDSKIYSFGDFKDLILFLKKVPYWQIDRILGTKNGNFYKGQLQKLKTRISVRF